MTFLWLIFGVIAAYLLVTLFLTYVVHRIPRDPVVDPPDWGHVMDTRIPAPGGGELEVWRVEPDGPRKGIVVLAHGWSRNRDRMVNRARIFGQMGFETVMHSARDHGKSSPYRFMNALRFAEDIEAVLDWIDEPALLYGHSAGAAGAIIAASRNPGRIRLLFLEGCYAHTKKSLLSLYRNFNPFFGSLFAPMVVNWMDLFYGFRLDSVSPARLARDLDMPVLIVHGEEDRNFPLPFAWELRESFPAGRAELFVGKGSDHSSCSLTPEFPEALKSFVRRHLPEEA